MGGGHLTRPGRLALLSQGEKEEEKEEKEESVR